MTEAEAEKIVNTLNAYFNGVLLDVARRAWRLDVLPYPFEEAMLAVREYAGAETAYPNFARFKEAIAAVCQRRRMQPSKATQLPPEAASMSEDERRRRSDISRGVAMDNYQKKIRDCDMSQEFEVRLTMTNAEIAARRKWLPVLTDAAANHDAP